VFEETLHRLSTLAVQAPPVPETLRVAAEALRQGASAEETHIVYVPTDEFCWASDPPPKAKPIGDGGLRHVRQRLATTGVPLGFDVRKDGRIQGLAAAPETRGCHWVALPVPGRGNFSDMLLARGAWTAPARERALRLVEASLPALSVLIGRFLDATQASRQRDQLNALSEVARAITQTRDMEAVLTRLATTIAAVTDYEFASLNVLSEDGHSLRFRCLNQSRWSSGPQAKFWREAVLTGDLDPTAVQVVRTGQPVLIPDLQHDERLPSDMREVSRANLLASRAVLPLVYQDEVLGFLAVSSPRQRGFPPEEVQLLEGLAAQSAAAIKAVQNYEQLEASRQQLREYSERLRESVETQHRLARTDPLTGIPNRRYVEESLAAQCARSRREGSLLSVALADVDDFKKINDTFGHASGDRVLIGLAQLARDTCRAMDVVGRYGGDEFIFVLPLAGLEHAAAFAERLRGRVARKRLRLTGDKAATVTVSVGVADFSSRRADPDAVLQSADEALYRAKALGKDRVCVVEDVVTAS
jgi:diguanylate cyclase (GGDEF)-like protein